MPARDARGRSGRRQTVRDVAFRLPVDSGWMTVERTTLPISSLGAGADTRSSPGW